MVWRVSPRSGAAKQGIAFGEFGNTPKKRCPLRRRGQEKREGGRAMAQPLLEVRDLTVRLRMGRHREGTAVDGVSFTLDRGETLSIVGESGCGKTMTAYAVMGLLPPETGAVAGGQILFEGEDLTCKSEREMCAIRGRKIAMVFQDPMSSLNPVYRIGTQMRESLRAHGRISRREAWEKSVRMLHKVGIALPEARLREFPHRLSGGQRQRVMIAMALLSDPLLLIADEPTSALDVTIQAQILELIRALQKETGTALLLITHDMGVVANNADRLLVMYAGKVMEYGTAEDIFLRPMHPYTRQLLAAIPRQDMDTAYLPTIEGVVPPPDRLPGGCRFASRCAYQTALCREREPAALACGGHLVYCHRAGSRETENAGLSPAPGSALPLSRPAGRAP